MYTCNIISTFLNKKTKRNQPSITPTITAIGGATHSLNHWHIHWKWQGALVVAVATQVCGLHTLVSVFLFSSLRPPEEVAGGRIAMRRHHEGNQEVSVGVPSMKASRTFCLRTMSANLVLVMDPLAMMRASRALSYIIGDVIKRKISRGVSRFVGFGGDEVSSRDVSDSPWWGTRHPS